MLPILYSGSAVTVSGECFPFFTQAPQSPLSGECFPFFTQAPQSPLSGECFPFFTQAPQSPLSGECFPFFTQARLSAAAALRLAQPLPPGPYRLLEMIHAGGAAVQHDLAELVEHGGGRRVDQ